METKKQVQEILVLYQEKLEKKVFGKEIFPADSINPSRHQSLLHAKWMIEQALLFLENPEKKQKTQRWLGFIQGILWCCGVYTINQLRGHNR
jgi:hypothetical protein